MLAALALSTGCSGSSPSPGNDDEMVDAGTSDVDSGLPDHDASMPGHDASVIDASMPGHDASVIDAGMPGHDADMPGHDASMIDAGISGHDADMPDAGGGGGGGVSGIQAGAVWRFWDQGTEPAAGWNDLGFDDSSWDSGPAPLGFGEPYIQTQTRSGVITTYFRHEFTSAGGAAGLWLTARFDDGYVVYLNGVEIARSYSMPSGAVDENTLAGPKEATTYLIPSWTIDQFAHLIVEGTNVLAVEVHQESASSDDLVWDAALSVADDDSWYVVPTPTDRALSSVEFVDSQRGFVTGTFGVILRSTDGGDSWVDVSPNSSWQYRDVAAAIGPNGALHGWAIAGDGVVSTSNGGASWSEQFLPATAQALAALDHDTVLVAMNNPDLHGVASLFVSEGGGAWQPVDASIGIGKMRAIGGTGPNSAIAAGSDRIVRVERDGSGNWSVTELFDGASNPLRFVSVRFDSVAVQPVGSGQKIWVCGQFGNYMDSALMLSSIDGGATWRDESPLFLGPTRGCAFGDSGLGVTGSHKATYDYARDWQDEGSEGYVITFGAEAVGTSAWVVGGKGLIIKTDCADCVLSSSPQTGQAPACDPGNLIQGWTGRIETPRYMHDKAPVARGEITWTLESSSGCTATYSPSGALFTTSPFDSCIQELGSSDGLLTVDFAAQPWTFEVSGDFPDSCVSGDDVPTGSWILGSGVSHGDYIRGTFGTFANRAPCDGSQPTGNCTYAWSFEPR